MKEKKLFYVGVCAPWHPEKEPELMWDVAENKDYLCADLLHEAKGVRLPLLRVEAEDEKGAVKEYKKEVPQTKNWKLKHGWETA